MTSMWCIAKNGGGYTQTGVAKGLKVPCLFMIAEVSIRGQKKPGGWYTAYTRVYPPIHHCIYSVLGLPPFHFSNPGRGYWAQPPADGCPMYVRCMTPKKRLEFYM